MISANTLAKYIESRTIPQGRFYGQPFVLQPWQRRFLRGAFGQGDDAALTIGRGCGKTTFMSAILAATVDVDGPLVQPNAESVLVASSYEQARLSFRHVLHFIEASIDGHKGRFRIEDSANRSSIEDRETGARVRCLGSDPRRLHGLAPNLILADEIAQWPHTQIDAMLAALATSRGKLVGSRMLMIGTRAADPEHPFEKALNGGVGYSQVHAARKDDPPFQRRTWLRANPGLGSLPDLEAAIRQEAARAKRDPAALAQFRALRLNAGVSDTEESLLLDADVWAAAESVESTLEGPWCLGVDLGQSAALSGAAGYWPSTGALDGFAVVPERPSLAERGIRDGAGRLYIDAAARGELIQAGGRVADVGALLGEALRRWGRPSIIVADAWREAELRQELEAIDFPVAALVLRRMGFHDGGADVRAFRAACLDGKVTPRQNLLMRACMAHARTVSDPAGNQKLAKGGQGRKARARDDLAAAAILAVAEGSRRAAVDTSPTDQAYAVVV